MQGGKYAFKRGKMLVIWWGRDHVCVGGGGCGKQWGILPRTGDHELKFTIKRMSLSHLPWNRSGAHTAEPPLPTSSTFPRRNEERREYCAHRYQTLTLSNISEQSWTGHPASPQLLFSPLMNPWEVPCLSHSGLSKRSQAESSALNVPSTQISKPEMLLFNAGR